MEKKVFSATLQALRKEKKVTQEQLAQTLGVSPQAVSKWENGSYPEGDLLPAIADFFGVSIDYLYGRGDGEKTIEQKVFEAVSECAVKEFEETKRADEHIKVARLMRNLHWAMQLGTWVSFKSYGDPACDSKENPKMASVVVDDILYSYMGLREDNDFYVFLNRGNNKDIYEDLLKDTSLVEGLFKMLSDGENIRIIAFLYSLKMGEFASADVISKKLGIKKDKVQSFLEEMSKAVGYKDGGTSPISRAKIVTTEKDENAYSAQSSYGGLFMALLLIAREFMDLPQVFQLQINSKDKSWIDRDKVFNN